MSMRVILSILICVFGMLPLACSTGEKADEEIPPPAASSEEETGDVDLTTNPIDPPSGWEVDEDWLPGNVVDYPTAAQQDGYLNTFLLAYPGGVGVFNTSDPGNIPSKWSDIVLIDADTAGYLFTTMALDAYMYQKTVLDDNDSELDDLPTVLWMTDFGAGNAEMIHLYIVDYDGNNAPTVNEDQHYCMWFNLEPQDVPERYEDCTDNAVQLSEACGIDGGVTYNLNDAPLMAIGALQDGIQECYEGGSCEYLLLAGTRTSDQSGTGVAVIAADYTAGTPPSVKFTCKNLTTGEHQLPGFNQVEAFTRVGTQPGFNGFGLLGGAYGWGGELVPDYQGYGWSHLQLLEKQFTHDQGYLNRFSASGILLDDLSFYVSSLTFDPESNATMTRLYRNELGRLPKEVWSWDRSRFIVNGPINVGEELGLVTMDINGDVTFFPFVSDSSGTTVSEDGLELLRGNGLWSNAHSTTYMFKAPPIGATPGFGDWNLGLQAVGLYDIPNYGYRAEALSQNPFIGFKGDSTYDPVTNFVITSYPQGSAKISAGPYPEMKGIYLYPFEMDPVPQPLITRETLIDAIDDEDCVDDLIIVPDTLTFDKGPFINSVHLDQTSHSLYFTNSRTSNPNLNYPMKCNTIFMVEDIYQAEPVITKVVYGGETGKDDSDLLDVPDHITVDSEGYIYAAVVLLDSNDYKEVVRIDPDTGGVVVFADDTGSDWFNQIRDLAVIKEWDDQTEEYVEYLYIIADHSVSGNTVFRVDLGQVSTLPINLMEEDQYEDPVYIFCQDPDRTYVSVQGFYEDEENLLFLFDDYALEIVKFSKPDS